MSDYQYDLIVIGGGSGGVRAARIAAGHGAKVAICEEYRYGGTCVIRGCVPKKFMVYAAHFHEEFEDSQSYGWSKSPAKFDWNTLIENKDTEIDRLNNIYIKLLKNAGVEVFDGRGKFVGQHHVAIGSETLSTKKILIATGGTPFFPNTPGVDAAISSNEAFHLKELPKSIAIVGGGYIAVEFAGIFNGLGVDTHLIYRGDNILRGFDNDIREHLANEIDKKGIQIKLNTDIETITKQSNHKTLMLNNGDSLDVEQIMYATGRTPNTTDLGLESVGVSLGKKGEILVDENSQTNIPNIFAVGDVTDRIALTPVATMEGHAFADTQFGNKPRLADHNDVPSAVFSQPPVATVGLSEIDAKEKGIDVDTYRSEFRTLKHSITENTERTLMKLVVDKASDKVIGAHMVGADSAEIMQGIAIAIKAGATKANFDSTVGIHPSSAEEFCTMRTKD